MQKKTRLDGSISIWVYEGVARKAITKLKYRFAYEIATELAFYSAAFLKNIYTALPQRVILIPVPLHRIRKDWQGFNQSEETCKLIARQMGWKFVPDLFIRKKQTTPQVNLSEKARQKNILDIFAFNELYRSLITDHQSLIIFDDVWTTGATLREAGKVLK